MKTNVDEYHMLKYTALARGKSKGLWGDGWVRVWDDLRRGGKGRIHRCFLKNVEEF